MVVEPADYAAVLEALDWGRGSGAPSGRRWPRRCSGTSATTTRPSRTSSKREGGADDEESSASRRSLEVKAFRLQTLRYGENPDQAAAFYGYPGFEGGLAGLTQLHGKELSYNNLLDLDGALLALSPFAFSPKPAVCIIKHTTPCGLAIGETARGGL